MSDFYSLRADGTVEAHNDVMRFGREFDSPGRWQLATLCGGKAVSTVFLGLDHRVLGIGPPILFETMVFPRYEPMVRYATKAEALDGHLRMVKAMGGYRRYWSMKL